MKTIWIEDDYLLELALSGQDEILRDVVACDVKLPFLPLYCAVACLPLIRRATVLYLLRQMRPLPASYLRRVSALGINLRKIARTHPWLAHDCRRLLREVLAEGSDRLEAGSPSYRTYWLTVAGDGYEVWVMDEWGYSSAPVSAF